MRINHETAIVFLLWKHYAEHEDEQKRTFQEWLEHNGLLFKENLHPYEALMKKWEENNK